MSSITAVITAYRRPNNIGPLVQAIRKQSVPAAAIWAWANEPSDKMKVLLHGAKLDRVVTSSTNAFFHGRFALALLAPTEFVAIFDDDSIPGENWFANCLETMEKTPGILGTAGVVLYGEVTHKVEPPPSPQPSPGGRGREEPLPRPSPGGRERYCADYAKRTMQGWQKPSEETVEVDLVGQVWFLRTEWVKYLFSCAAVTGTNGEDIELAARAWRLAGIRSFCPAHPPNDQSRWGSTRGLELGLDEAAASLRVEHLSERKKIVEAEMEAGWVPLYLRVQGSCEGSGFGVQGSENVGQPGYPRAGAAVGASLEPSTRLFLRDETVCGPRWVTEYAYPLGDNGEARTPPAMTLRLNAPDGEICCADCVEAIESLGDRLTDDIAPTFDCIECGQGLERVRDPLSFLRRARQLLTQAGQIVGSVANVQRKEVIRGLIEGRWQGNTALRYFSRRELEKLFYRAGLRVAIRAVRNMEDGLPSPSSNGDGLGRPSSGSEEADDLNTQRFEIEAMPDETADYGLTSIVIVTHNQLACTHACLTSIRFVTDEPYELIVVDNGSNDGTVEYLRNCPDVTLIENAENRGFPAAVNQGIRVARGEQVLLLNNDVIVPTGWLRRMLEALERTGFGVQGSVEGARDVESGATRPHPSPLPKGEGTRKSKIGMVGPLTNCASAFQEIPIGYADLACLDGYAWEHAKANARQVQEVDRLIGFCLLIRREVIDDVGLFDERFGIGNFEDDDFCRRAREAGWRLVVANDAFIHHFGHRSFDAAGIDLNALLEKNKRIYDEKWAGGKGSGFGVQGSAEGSVGNALRGVPHAEDGLPSPSQEQRDGLGRPSSNSHPSSPVPSCSLSPVTCSLSLCMIVRDNERTIRAALESAKPWVDEIIVVDTGSTDRTPDICRELGARVYHFPWPDSFAVARNESLKYARGEWIFWMDSDDVIDAENGRKLRQLVTELVRVPASVADGPNSHESSYGNPKSKIENPKLPLGFVMQVHCPGSGEDGGHDVTVVDHLKLFRNRADLRFEGRIHEQVLDAINRAGGDVVFTDIFVVHAGADHSAEGRQRKLKRDIRLLTLDRRERPNHPFVFFNLGMTYADAGKHRKAIQALRRSLELAQPHESHVRKIYALLVTSHRELGEQAAARQAAAEGLKLFPKDPELLFRNALLLHEDGRLRAAELSYQAALANDDALHFGSIDRGIVGFKARHNLAAVFTDMGAVHKAEDQWRRIVAEVPTYRSGWQGLVENLIMQGRLNDAAQAAQTIAAAASPLRGLGMALAARVAETAGQPDAAVEMLRQARHECPNDVAPLDELCRLLFYRGDPAELEVLLRELVQLQPANGAALHNLGTVLAIAGQHARAAESFRASLAQRPDSPLTFLSLGYALRSAGLSADANTAFAECVRLNPPAPVAAAAQRQLAALAA